MKADAEAVAVDALLVLRTWLEIIADLNIFGLIGDGER